MFFSPSFKMFFEKLETAAAVGLSDLKEASEEIARKVRLGCALLIHPDGSITEAAQPEAAQPEAAQPEATTIPAVGDTIQVSDGINLADKTVG